jgi:hypothetical protein
VYAGEGGDLLPVRIVQGTETENMQAGVLDDIPGEGGENPFQKIHRPPTLNSVGPIRAPGPGLPANAFRDPSGMRYFQAGRRFMLEIPEESLQVHRVVASAMSRHTFAIVQPSKYGVENQELATGIGVKWKGQYLLLTAGHVVDFCPEDTLRFFLPARDIQLATTPPEQPLTVKLRGLVKLRQPTPPVFADHPVDLAAIVLSPQPNVEECFAALGECAIMPADNTQVGVFGYPGATKIPMDKNYLASPEHFFGRLNVTGDACRHEPQQDFTIPYDLPHHANGYSGSGVWHWSADPIWSPQPHLCGILATECTIDKVVSGFRIETVVKFLQDNEELLRP